MVRVLGDGAAAYGIDGEGVLVLGEGGGNGLVAIHGEGVRIGGAG